MFYRTVQAVFHDPDYLFITVSCATLLHGLSHLSFYKIRSSSSFSDEVKRTQLECRPTGSHGSVEALSLNQANTWLLSAREDEWWVRRTEPQFCPHRAFVTLNPTQAWPLAKILNAPQFSEKQAHFENTLTKINESSVWS